MGIRLTKPVRAELKPFFKASLRADGTLDIQIYQDIGEDYWSYDSGITAKSISQQIEAAGTGYSKILVRINSRGGDVFEGVAIYTLIRAQKKPVEVRVDGWAASAASIIAMAGDEIIMGPNTLMMIHNAWTYCQGYASDMRKMADALDKISGAIAQTYVTRTKKALNDVIALMDAETYMTAQECVDEGFATQIVTEADELGVTAQAMARKFVPLGRAKELPEKVRAAEGDMVCACACANCQDGDCANCSNAECMDPNCEDCPMQVEASNLSLFEARARMLLRTGA